MEAWPWSWLFAAEEGRQEASRGERINLRGVLDAGWFLMEV